MKNLLVIFLVLLSLCGFSQPQTINNGESGLSVRTKLNAMFSQLYDLNMTIEYSALRNSGYHQDYTSTDLYMRLSTDLGGVWTDPLFLFDGINLEDSLNTNGNRIVELPTPIYGSEAANKDYVDSRAAGIDSITYDSDYYIRVYLDGVVLDSTYIQAGQNVFTVTLPISGTLAGSAAACTELPSGWVLSTSGSNLLINHGLGKYHANLSIKYNSSGDIYRLLRPFDNAFQNVQDTDNNNIVIEGISGYYTAAKLQIKISF